MKSLSPTCLYLTFTGVKGDIKENMCAFPEVTNEPATPEFRPTTPVHDSRTTDSNPDVVWTDDNMEADGFLIAGYHGNRLTTA